MEYKQYTYADLFHGIGGFRSGFERIKNPDGSPKFICKVSCEIDKHAQKVYENLYDTKGEKQFGDIRTINPSDFSGIDIITAGFPCQDISVAGKQKGFKGKRSSLFFTVTGIIRLMPEESRPPLLLFENVKNFLSINGGWDFLAAIAELDALGYDVEWAVLDSAEIVPQHRERVFLVAHLRGRSTRKIFPIRRVNQETTQLQGQQTNTITAKCGTSGYRGSYIIAKINSLKK